MTMSQMNGGSSPHEEEETKSPSWWKLHLFWFIIVIDCVGSIVLAAPISTRFSTFEGEIVDHYTFYATLWDLAAVAVLRFLTASFALIVGYYTDKAPPESPFELVHRNGVKKTREELEFEGLEEPVGKWFRRYSSRPAFACELVTFASGIFAIVKCFARLDIELGVYKEAVPFHPIFWTILLFAFVFSTIESAFIDGMSLLAGECGRSRRAALGHQGSSWLRRIGSNLSIPLLGRENGINTENGDVEEGANGETNGERRDEDLIGASDITSDAVYKAKWTDLLAITYPDIYFITIAFVFLLLAAAAQICIPRYTGKILDALSGAFAGSNNEANADISIWDVPGFVPNVVRLLVASVLCGIFSGLRGSIFTVVGGRVNVRLRTQLMDALLAQDIGFFDVTKTGDITSRLSSDTTLVGDQVTLNVNVFLRSLVQVIGFLIFMFLSSWQLSLIAFVSVPIITILSKWYGEFVRKLAKLMQKKLADGNSVSEAAMGSMSTVRAFDAAESELKEFEKCMQEYLGLNVRSAVVYCAYCTAVVAQPNMVTAIVLFYGGLLVRNGDMSSGDLVSFLLYLQSLSDAFGSIGYIFSSLTSAVGAADKVFELMNRKPKLTKPAVAAPDSVPSSTTLGGLRSYKTNEQRFGGVSPESCQGEITLKNVEMYYPARPQRKVLDDLSLTVPPGSVVALVGPSGSGKSSVMSLVQHLYEPSSGDVMIDGVEVHDLNPMWLSRKVSVVSQEPTLFARSVKRNIMYGLEGTHEEPSLEEIQQAAKLANAHDFIESLPFGYETDVGERGVQLSGGQKQRIAIARALVRKPRILLLDEATSALDAESEALVQEAIDDMLAKGRSFGEHGPAMTVLIVAHRLSTVRNADIIFVVQDGAVVEQGNHNDLTKNAEGAYAALIKRQMKAQRKLEGE